MPRRVAVGLTLLITAFAVVRPSVAAAQQPQLTSIVPAAVSTGTTVRVTGTGLGPSAATNEATFMPVGGGSPIAGTVTSVSSADASGTQRRLTIRVPDGLPIGPAQLTVRNVSTGQTSAAIRVEIVALTALVPLVNPGQALDLAVTLQGNGAFDPVSTRLTLGAGISVGPLTVESPRRLVARITVDQVAPAGPRTIGVLTPTMTAVRSEGLRVEALQAGNRVPVAVIGGATAGTAGLALELDGSGSSDPDNDPLSFLWDFGDGTAASGEAVSKTYPQAGTYTVTLTVLDGRGGAGTATRPITIAPVSPANRPPVITSSPATAAAVGQAYSYQLTATDPDNDPVTFSLVTAPAGMQISPTGLVTWTPAQGQSGTQAVSVRADDGRGGLDSQAFSINVARPGLTSLAIDPAQVTLIAAGATRALTVTGRFSDGSSSDLTAASTGTTYESSDPSVARVDPDGVVTAVANGVATITVRNSGRTATASVTVAIPATLTALDLVPARATLRSLGARVPLTLTGQFSDGSVRDLTASPEVTYTSADTGVAGVAAGGVVTAAGAGRTTVRAAVNGLSAESQIDVVLGAGTGFVRGEVFDDRTGLPLAGATVTLLADGNGDLLSPLVVTSDARGRYLLPAQAGEVLVRIGRAGFTTVDRRGTAPIDGIVTLLDARITPRDARVSSLQSVFGGQARNQAGDVTLDVPPGGLGGDAGVTLTSISPQGLAGRLPFGWSPVAAVDVSTGGPRLEQPATLRVSSPDGAVIAGPVVLAFYDPVARAWIAQDAALASPDGRTITATVPAVGQYVALVADQAPFVPPAPVPGEPLQGVEAAVLPVTATAEGRVVPRSAPPGEDARAVGTAVVRAAQPLPSGVVIEARVGERFDLLDRTQVVPLPYTQDLVLYARPRFDEDATLGARFPITPSRTFTLQDLALGVVRLDLHGSPADEGGGIVAAGGGSVVAPGGVLLDVPAGALASDQFVGLTPIQVERLSAPVPPALEALGAVVVDLVGFQLSLPASLSIPRPSGLDASSQVLLAQVFADPFGVRRLRLVGGVDVQPTRLVSRATLNGVTLDGIVSGGEYVFVRALVPVGLVSATIRQPGGTAPQPLVLVTSDTAVFADLSRNDGRAVVAGRTATDSTITAADAATGNGGEAAARVNAVTDVVTVAITLGVAAPTMVATSPAAGAVNVPLDSTITITFSEAIEPASLTAGSFVVRAGTTDLAGARVLSADRRRVTFRPDAALPGNAVVAVTLTSAVLDLTGNGLANPSTFTFRTVDPSKPPQPDPGRITAELPDEDGFVLITGSPGTAEAGRPVTTTNPRTQETVTVLALEDGSFRMRLGAVVGDELTLTFREPGGREVTFLVSQFTGPDGATSIGVAGGTFSGGGRVASIRPRSLVAAGIFQFREPAAAALPNETGDFAYVDRFAISTGAAQFTQLRSLVLSESQGRFPQVLTGEAPFTATGSLVVPPDFLVSASLRFSATATDAPGRRQTADGVTVVVGSAPDTSRVEVPSDAEFPLVYLDVPRQALPNQQVSASAVAPAARIEFEVPAPPPGAGPPPSFFLVSAVSTGTDRKLRVLDEFSLLTASGTSRLRTTGRTLPGVTGGGDYGVVGMSVPISYVTGRVTGPPAIVTVDNWPLAAVTTTANGRFVLPVRASATLTLRFLDAATLAVLGQTTVQTLAQGTSDVGTPLGTGAATLTVTAMPDARSIVDIGDPLVFTFSEAVDSSSVTASSILVTDAAGRRVFGRFAYEGDGRVVTFTPLRRWKYATRYRYGVAQTVRALSGATLAQPFNGEFTTFAPRLVASASSGDARDVAVTSGGVAAVVGDSGLAVVDVSSPAAPVVRANVPLTGGARGVSVREGALVDRGGTSRPGPVAVVAAGSPSGTGRAEIVSLATPTAPAVIGRTQLTTAPGQAAPQGVPAAPGRPSSVVLSEQGRAVVAVEGVGVATLGLSSSVPDDPANPGRALGARFPEEGTASFVQAVIVGDQILAVGPSGLTVLEATSLLRRGGVAIQNAPVGVAGLAGFAMDRDGDGAIAASETFDLAVVAGGIDGTLQFFRVPFPGDPELISVVRLDGVTTGVTLDAAERLAYVGLGEAGVAIVDLDGPASVQPVDLDRDGVDDRLLGRVDTPGTARRVARSRSLALAADGAAGLAILQVQPPRTRFLSLKRDPLSARPGDESEVPEHGLAFNTDDAILVTLDVSVAPQGSLRLLIEERPDDPAAARRLRFADGTTAVALTAGLVQLTVPQVRGEGGGTSAITLRVVDENGRAVAARSFRLADAAAQTGRVTALQVVPFRLELDDARTSQGVSVAALLEDGRSVNVTPGSTGTTYHIEDPRIAVVGPDGQVFRRAGGTTRLTVSHRGVTSTAVVAVTAAGAFDTFAIDRTHMTLSQAGEVQSLRVRARLTDGTFLELPEVGAAVISSDPAVVSVDGRGRLIAVADGTATVTVRVGSATVEIPVAVELRQPASVTAIDLEPFVVAARTDEASIDARARITGTGSLDGLVVEFTRPGGQSVRAPTDRDGWAVGRLTGLTTAGSVSVTARVTDPATGASRADTETLVIEAAGADAEPNDTPANAPRVAFDGTAVTGSLGNGDARDIFRAETRVPGTVTMRVTLPLDVPPARVRLLRLSASGAVLEARLATGPESELVVDAAAGESYFAVESVDGGAVGYSLQLLFVQGPVAIADVVPRGGGPGTSVTITGSGFSTDTEDVRVLFGGVMGRVVSASPAQVTALVPAHAVNGPVTVVVTARRAEGPLFDVGRPGPVPRPTWRAGDPANIRFDPVLQARVDVKRLAITADPVVTRAQVEALVVPLGGAIVGTNAVLNEYLIEFASNSTLAGLAALSRTLSASPLVRRVRSEGFNEVSTFPIDARRSTADAQALDLPFLGIAFDHARVFQAIDAIRQTPPFVGAGATFRPVTIGVIDTGFAPFDGEEYRDNGVDLVRLFQPDDEGRFSERPFGILTDPDGHGTRVTSVIAAVNNGRGTGSGVFGGLFAPGEARFQVVVYAEPTLAETSVANALTELAARGDIDVLNLSFGRDWPGPSPAFLAMKEAYADLFALFAGRTLIVASAGNGGVQAEFHLPSALEMTLPYVMSVAALAVLDFDRSGEFLDGRAVFAGSPAAGTSAPCRPGLGLGGSNCGRGITLAAPGEEVLVLTTKAPGWALDHGTSFAAPMVSGVAALMLAVQPAGSSLAPDRLRRALVDSGDDITRQFHNLDVRAVEKAGLRPDPVPRPPIRRLNALNAVRAMLDPSAPQMIYVADQQPAGDGRVIGIDVDPITGARPSPRRPDDLNIIGASPIATIMSPLGDRLFVVVPGDAEYGDGLLVINTRSNQVTGFIAFSGAPFPRPRPADGTAPPPLPPPIRVPTLKPGLAFSKDGRLLYAGIGTRLIVINVADGRVVNTATDLPAEYAARAPLAGPSLFAERLAAIRAQVERGIEARGGRRAGVSISGLALAPDGSTLYAAVSTGGGAEQQPGGILAIDVNLYRDALPEVPGLQSDLSTYLTPASQGVLAMVDAGGFLGGDEPSGIAVSADGRHVYLVNGGLNFFEAIPAPEFDVRKYGPLVSEPLLATLRETGSFSVAGLAAALPQALYSQNQLVRELLSDMREIAASGQTLISAPGVTGVFSMDGAGGLQPAWAFPSDVNFGWNPDPAAGGLIVNQFRFGSVFAKRPFGIAMRPDGRRALLPLFQTGNLAVLDLDVQRSFSTRLVGLPPNPAFAQLPDTMFQGVVGVTEALRLDNHLWPSRGAFQESAEQGSTFMPSPDENLLFPWAVEYAQNGRWAAMVHAGRGEPRPVTAVVPNLETNVTARRQLQLLGYDHVNGVLVARDPATEPRTIASGDVLTFERGGGALSVVNDALLTQALLRDATEPAFVDGRQRPRLASVPICTAPTSDPGIACGDAYSPVRTEVAYDVERIGRLRYRRPRGVAIQPFVVIESPRFGDHVGVTSAFTVAWRDSRVREFSIRVLDLEDLDQSGQPRVVGTRSGALGSSQVAQRSLSAVFGLLFSDGAFPIRGRRYRVEVALSINIPALQELSRTSVEVVFDQQPDAETPPDTLDLTPTLVPVLTVPTPAGDPVQLEVTLDPADGDPVDVTASSDTTYLWLGGTSNPLVQLALDLAGVDVTRIVNDIKTDLEQALGVELPFRVGDITVDGSGRLRVLSPGLQVVQAVHRRDGRLIFAAPSVVLAGLELTSIDLEPDTLTNTVAGEIGAGRLYQKMTETLGKKKNVPMVLVPGDAGTFSLFDRTGDIELEDVEFTYLGQGKISLNRLIARLEPLIRRQLKKALGRSYTAQQWLAKEAGAALAAKAVAKLVKKGVAEVTLTLVDFKSANPNVATVDNAVTVTSPTKGEVTAHEPGLTAVTGVLDLGRFGKAQDFVPVYVLPQLTEVRPDPINLVLCADDRTGVKVRTLAVMRLADAVTFDADLVNVEIESDADKRFQKLVGGLLEKFLPVGSYFDEEFTLGDFKFGMRGVIEVNAEGGAVTYRDFDVYFTVPNTSGVVNTFTFQDDVPPDGIPPAVSDVAAVRSTARFTKLVGAIGPGRAVNQVFVSMPVVGAKQGVGSVTVTELCQTPAYIKRNLTGVTEIIGVPRDLTYLVSVYNPTDTPLENVEVRDIATYFREPPTGEEDDATEVVQVRTLERVDPNSRVDAVFLVPTFGYSRIENRAEVSAGQGRSVAPVGPCQIAPCADGDEVTGGQDDPEPPPATPDFCVQNPSDPVCICFGATPPAECVVRPEPVIAKRKLRLVKEVVSPPDVNGQPSPVLVGTQVVYRIAVFNEGPDPVDGIVLTDVTVLSGPAGGSAVPVERRQDFFIGRLLPGQGAQRVVRFPDVGVIPAGAGYGGGVLFNRLTVNVDDVDPAEVTNPVVESALVVTKRLVDPAGDADATLVRGSVVRYEVTIANIGTGPSQPLTLTDMAYVVGQAQPPVYEGTLTLGVIGPGMSMTRTVEFVVPTLAELAPLPCTPVPGIGCPIYYEKTAYLQNDLFGPGGLYAGTTHRVVNPELDVQVRLVAPVASALLAGSTATYEVSVTNVSEHVARNVHLDVTTRLANLVVTAAGQQLVTMAGQRVVELGSLEPGATRVGRFTVPIAADAAGVDIQRVETSVRVNYRQRIAATTSHPVVDPAVVITPTLANPGPNALLIEGQPPVLLAADAVTYAVAVTNVTASPLSNVPVTHVVTREGRDATGVTTSTSLAGATTTLPVIAAGATATFTITVTIPSGSNGGRLVLTVAAPGGGPARLDHGVVEPGPAGLLITEMVLDPKQDWSDSGPSHVGGDVPFDDRPGNGTVDAGDIWVEIAAPSPTTASWSVVLIDADENEFVQPLGTAIAGQRVKVLSGFGNPVLPIRRVDVRDDGGVVRQSLDIAAIVDQLGPATGPGNESLTWVIDGVPSPVLQQFLRRPATINRLFPF